MDNAIVGATGLVCFMCAQVSNSWIESVTPLTIVAVVVYFFLVKFDKKLDSLEKKTDDIHDEIKELAGSTKNGILRSNKTDTNH
ncbi:MAG: hypothetical protein IJF84_13310 [Thermoguttaceae bacterium]|nr:hypothetical protein [Thermoguttaceae bacterium]